MRVQLEYGRSGLPVELPADRDVRLLTYKRAKPLDRPEVTIQQVLDQPIGTPSLLNLARERRTACIAICDITRPVPNSLILPPILERLEAAGIARSAITILVATGLHRPNTRDELIEMVGRPIVDRYRIENHHGQTQTEHTFLGHSPRGIPIWIDSRYVQADLKIAVGLIEPHLMAGFSGGRKVICPGIASVDTIRVSHGAEILNHPRADCGILEGNPVHEENTHIARQAGCDFIVNAVIDSDRRPLRLVAGDLEQAFLEGVAFVRQIVSATVPKPVDVVVTSSAGYPLDTTFYQSVKGMTGAMPIVKHGGTIILAASMSEGIGSQPFAKLFEDHPSIDDFMRRINDDAYFAVDQWQLQKLAQVRRKARVKVVTDGLPHETIDRLFVESAPSVEQAVDESLREYGPDASIAVIPKGPYVLAQTGHSAA